MNILKFKQFEEVELKFKDLETRDRGNILMNKLASGGTFSKMGGGEISFPKMRTPDLRGETQSSIGVGFIQDPNTRDYSHSISGEYLATRGSERGTRYRNVFLGQDGEYSLKNIVKTKEFGSGGAGVRTKIFEAIQIVFMAIRQDGVHLRPSESLDIFKAYIDGNHHLNNVFTQTPINSSMIDMFRDEPDWIYTFTKLPNELFKANRRYIDRDKKYLFFHEGYSSVNKLSPNEIISDKIRLFLRSNQVKINIAKFCPADVYLVDSSSYDEIIRELSASNTIQMLINVMDELFAERKLVPISMKMLGKNTRFKIITNNKLNTRTNELTPVKFEYQWIGISRSKNIGIGSAICVQASYQEDTKKRVMILQSPRTSVNNNAGGEVIGSTSRGHGKISFKKIHQILTRYLPKEFKNLPLNTFSQLYILDDNCLYRLLADTYRDVNNRISGTNNLGRTDLGGRKIISDDDVILDRRKVISKIQSLQMIKIILEIRINTRNCNKALSEMFKYALSIQIVDDSGNKIDTPNYLRVI